MSELKAIESATAVIEKVYLVYRKSEADEVISTIKAERDEYRYNLSCARNEIYNLQISMREDVTTIAEKDAEIAELKEQYKDMDVTHTVHIAEMNAKIEEQENCIAELKAKLEDVQASMYADVVDANMENLRLKEERRWRKFSEEMPPKYTWCLVSGKSQMGNYIVITDFYEEDDWAENPILDDDTLYIEWWMPLPSAPKEA